MQSSPPETKQCPFCAETIFAAAIVCRYCGRDLVGKEFETAEQHQLKLRTKKKSTPAWKTCLAVVMAFIVLGVCGTLLNTQRNSDSTATALTEVEVTATARQAVTVEASSQEIVSEESSIEIDENAVSAETPTVIVVIPSDTPVPTNTPDAFTVAPSFEEILQYRESASGSERNTYMNRLKGAEIIEWQGFVHGIDRTPFTDNPNYWMWVSVDTPGIEGRRRGIDAKIENLAEPYREIPDGSWIVFSGEITGHSAFLGFHIEIGDAVFHDVTHPTPTATGTATNTSTHTPIPSSTPIPTNTPVPTATPLPTPAPRMGQDVHVGDIRWHFHEAIDLGNRLTSDNMFVDDKVTDGRFIRVRFTMENFHDSIRTYTGINLVDSQGRNYVAASGMSFFIPNAEYCVFENLNPNVPKTCTLIFEVPRDATGLKAHVGGMQLFGNPAAYIDLGF